MEQAFLVEGLLFSMCNGASDNVADEMPWGLTSCLQVNQPMVKLASLHIILPTVTEPTDHGK